MLYFVGNSVSGYDLLDPRRRLGRPELGTKVRDNSRRCHYYADCDQNCDEALLQLKSFVRCTRNLAYFGIDHSLGLVHCQL